VIVEVATISGGCPYKVTDKSETVHKEVAGTARQGIAMVVVQRIVIINALSLTLNLHTIP